MLEAGKNQVNRFSKRLPHRNFLLDAFNNFPRKDLLGLQEQLDVAIQAHKAVKAERLPTLAFNGDYGVLGVIGGLYHGVFAATGKVSVPVFQEAQLRGEGEVAGAQVIALRQQIESLRVSIEWQIRSAMLDVQSSN